MSRRVHESACIHTQVKVTTSSILTVQATRIRIPTRLRTPSPTIRRLEGDPGHFLYPLKKPTTTDGQSIQEIWASEWEYMGSRGTTEGKGPFPGNSTITKVSGMV